MVYTHVYGTSHVGMEHDLLYHPPYFGQVNMVGWPVMPGVQPSLTAL